MKRLLIGLCCFSTICHADIYVITDQHGNQTYSDTPSAGAAKVMLPGSSTISTETTTKPNLPASPVSPTASSVTAVPDSTGYTDFLIDSPLDQQTYNNNQRDIPVLLTIKPDLQKGDRTQLFLDGKAVGSPSVSTQLTLNNVDRGMHQLYAVIVDSNNSMIKQSQTVTINLHYIHAGNTGAAP